MRERVCKNCGGRQYKVVGQNMVKCMFCGTLYVDEQASKEEEVLTVGAYEKLRDCQFDQAKEEFDKILSLYPMSFEGHYGKVQAKYKIVFYTNKRGLSKRPRFFGDEIPSILEDEDFKLAVQNAPPEVAKTYNDQAKRIEKIRKTFLEESSKKHYDIIACALDFDKNEESLISKTIEELKKQNLEVYFVQDLPQKEREEDTFQALQTAKAFIFFANDKKGYNAGEIKNLYDRYLYFASQKKKTKSSLIVALDSANVSVSDVPKELIACKSVVDMAQTSFLQDIQVKVKKEMENSVQELAKIDTVKIEKVEPQRKAYVDIESISPSELGHYHVDNIELSDANKIKWIFLTLKNGDFVSATDLISKGLEKDANNSELLFAQLMAENKIKTQEEFFQNVANFRDKEKIDKILTYASKDFAEYFVDSWENLIIKLDSEEYYNAFLLYLAQFSSPNRDNFVEKAENKAVETLNEELIDKVLKCFKSDEIERFVEFYFMLAQKSDDQKYYQKILDIDEGHEPSNIALLLQHFKTDEDKLEYRDKEEIETVFKYLSESTRAQFVSSVVNMILPIAFYDLSKAEAQLDFYLSYVSENGKLVEILRSIANTLQEQGFFKQAEKYLSIAISKDNSNGELYWQLIKVKAHCKTDNELIMSNVKISQMPEWETLLSLSNEEQTERYAEITSKMNLYSGEKMAFREDMPDKVHLIQDLKEFVARNEKILLEMEKQEGERVLKGVKYYRLQLKPFESYIEKIESLSDFKEYQGIFSKLNMRLEALNLTLSSSVNVIDLLNKDEGLKTILQDEKTKEKRRTKQIKDIRKDKFLKKFLYIFLELFPLLFTTLLLIVLVSAPKEVYLYFSQEFLIVLVILSTIIGAVNLIVFINIRHKISKKWNIANIALFSIAGLNLVLMCCGLYFFPVTMNINSVKEMQVLLKNASYSNFKLTKDIDMKDISWTSVNFSGTLDGDGHSITNLKFNEKQDKIGLFKRNSGEIKNLNIYLTEKAYSNIDKFGTIARSNHGLIENCSVYGTVVLNFNESATVGGICGTMSGGSILNCTTNLTITINIEQATLKYGGLVGEIGSGTSQTIVNKSTNNANVVINSNESENIYAGGLVGMLRHIDAENINISQNSSNMSLSVNGNGGRVVAGGLVGQGYSSSENNYATGKIDTSNFVGSGYVGGLYGQYENSTLSDSVKTSYSIVQLNVGDSIKVGGLVGGLGGKVSSSFTNTTIDFAGEKKFSSAQADNCLKLTTKFYDKKLGFDENIWNITDSTYPTLK